MTRRRGGTRKIARGPAGTFAVYLPKHLVEELGWQHGGEVQVARDGEDLRVSYVWESDPRNLGGDEMQTGTVKVDRPLAECVAWQFTDQGSMRARDPFIAEAERWRKSLGDGLDAFAERIGVSDYPGLVEIEEARQEGRYTGKRVDGEQRKQLVLALLDHRAELIDELASRHGGRVGNPVESDGSPRRLEATLRCPICGATLTLNGYRRTFYCGGGHKGCPLHRDSQPTSGHPGRIGDLLDLPALIKKHRGGT